jgi:hypothetical protein
MLFTGLAVCSGAVILVQRQPRSCTNLILPQHLVPFHKLILDLVPLKSNQVHQEIIPC